MVRQAPSPGLLPFTIGSDGGGSTRLPAAYSGVVGLHTTRGLIPHLDYEKPTMMLTASYGPLARSVRDAAIVTRAIGGPDGRDYVCIQTDTPDCVASLESGVDGMRLAWTDDFGFASRYAGDQSDRIIALARESAAGLDSLGATVEPTDEVWEDRAELGTVRWTVEPSAYEAMVGTNLTPLQAVDPDLYREQAESRARNWEKFRALSETTTRSCRSRRRSSPRPSRSGTPRGRPTAPSSPEEASHRRTAATP